MPLIFPKQVNDQAVNRMSRPVARLSENERRGFMTMLLLLLGLCVRPVAVDPTFKARHVLLV